MLAKSYDDLVTVPPKGLPPMPRVFESLLRQNLSVTSHSASASCFTRETMSPARVCAIAQMARQFGVGAPTLREALEKLETLGVVDIRHGSSRDRIQVVQATQATNQPESP